MSARRPYVRSMNGWWRKDAYFVRYMMREATAVFVVAYAVVLLVGVVGLAQGEAAYNAWLQALREPGSVAFHVVTLAAFAYHTVSWFSIMPKTIPVIRIRGKKLPSTVITGTGLATAAVLNALLFIIVLAMKP